MGSGQSVDRHRPPSDEPDDGPGQPLGEPEVRSSLGIGEGHITAGGPWSAAKIAIEHARIDALVASIGARGFVTDEWPTGRILLDGDDWAINPHAGQHRAAVAEAMGLRTIPMVFEAGIPPVRRSEGRHWPAVRAGLFRIDEAMAVFDGVMAATPPPGCPHPGSPDRLGWQAERGNAPGRGS